jgi:hypothetical protein
MAGVCRRKRWGGGRKVKEDVREQSKTQTNKGEQTPSDNVIHCSCRDRDDTDFLIEKLELC